MAPHRGLVSVLRCTGLNELDGVPGKQGSSEPSVHSCALCWSEGGRQGTGVAPRPPRTADVPHRESWGRLTVTGREAGRQTRAEEKLGTEQQDSGARSRVCVLAAAWGVGANAGRGAGVSHLPRRFRTQRRHQHVPT